LSFGHWPTRVLFVWFGIERKGKMLSRVDFIQVISEKERMLRKAGYSDDVIMELELDVFEITGTCSREDYIRTLDRMITSNLMGIVAELN